MRSVFSFSSPPVLFGGSTSVQLPTPVSKFGNSMSYRRPCWNSVSLLARSNAISLLRVMLMSKEKAKKEPQKTLKEKRKEKKDKKGGSGKGISNL